MTASGYTHAINTSVSRLIGEIYTASSVMTMASDTMNFHPMYTSAYDLGRDIADTKLWRKQMKIATDKFADAVNALEAAFEKQADFLKEAHKG